MGNFEHYICRLSYMFEDSVKKQTQPTFWRKKLETHIFFGLMYIAYNL